MSKQPSFFRWKKSKQRPDAAPPEAGMQRIVARMVKESKDAAAPPSDAAQPLAWRWYFKGQTGGWRYSDSAPEEGCAGWRDIVIQPLYDHPEDAPGSRDSVPPEGPQCQVWFNGGCFRVGHIIEGNSFDFRGMTESQAEAICNALNREVRDKGDKTDG